MTHERCNYCGTPLGFLDRLKKRAFCSEEHRSAYLEEMNRQARQFLDLEGPARTSPITKAREVVESSRIVAAPTENERALNVIKPPPVAPETVPEQRRELRPERSPDQAPQTQFRPASHLQSLNLGYTEAAQAAPRSQPAPPRGENQRIQTLNLSSPYAPPVISKIVEVPAPAAPPQTAEPDPPQAGAVVDTHEPVDDKVFYWEEECPIRHASPRFPVFDCALADSSPEEIEEESNTPTGLAGIVDSAEIGFAGGRRTELRVVQSMPAITASRSFRGAHEIRAGVIAFPILDRVTVEDSLAPDVEEEIEEEIETAAAISPEHLAIAVSGDGAGLTGIPAGDALRMPVQPSVPGAAWRLTPPVLRSLPQAVPLRLRLPRSAGRPVRLPVLLEEDRAMIDLKEKVVG